MELLNTVAPSQKDTSGREERKPDGRSRGRWLPSGADILFCAVLCAFAMGRGAVDLLDDGDPGWHISNGRHILATWSIPHRDYFSWTRAGHVWFAWEWLFDAIEGVLHHLGGLNAVVFLAAMLIALSYRRLFQEAFRRSGGTGWRRQD